MFRRTPSVPDGGNRCRAGARRMDRARPVAPRLRSGSGFLLPRRTRGFGARPPVCRPAPALAGPFLQRKTII